MIAYSVFYIFASFAKEMPWATCTNDWNTIHCVERVQSSYAVFVDDVNTTHVNNTMKPLNVDNRSISPAEEYFNRHVLNLHLSSGIDNLGPIKFDLAVCLGGIYFISRIYSKLKDFKATIKTRYLSDSIYMTCCSNSN